MTPDQLQALTWLACETRKETHGAAPWDKPGTHALIERHCGSWGFNLAVEHVLAHARDPKARTPAVIVGPMPHTTPERGHRHPVKAGSPDECPTHQGQPTDNCSGCTADRLAGDTTTTTTPRHQGRPPTDTWRQARKAMKP